MNPYTDSRRHFIQGLVACAMQPACCVFARSPPFLTQATQLTSAVVKERIGAALDLQALYAVALDQADIDALTNNRHLRVTSGSGQGRYRGRDAALRALQRHGASFGRAAGSFLLFGVRPRCLRRSDLAAARQTVCSKATGDHQFIYGVYPDRRLLDDQVEATLIAAWD